MSTVASNEDIFNPIHDQEAEQVLLGRMVASGDRDLVLSISKQVRRHDLFFDPHREVFSTLVGMASSGASLTGSAILERFSESSDAKATINNLFLSKNWAGTNLDEVIKRVREKSHLRQLRDLNVRSALQCAQGELTPDRISQAVLLEAGTLQTVYTERETPHLLCMKDVETKPVTWWWKPYFALGKLTLVAGDPGTAKSYISTAIAKANSRGGGLPGMVERKPGVTLMFFTEDGIADTVKPRLEAQGGCDFDKIFSYNQPISLDDKGVLLIESMICETEASIVILDPITAYLKKTDVHRANEVRERLEYLMVLGEKYGCAIVVLIHCNKNTGDAKTMYRILGSIDFIAAARSVLMVGHDPQDETRRAFAQVKNNLVAHGPNQGFKLEPVGATGDYARVDWLETTDLTIEQMLQVEPRGRKAEAGERAKGLIAHLLKDGPKLIEDVTAAGRLVGISERTMRRAAKDLGVTTTIVEFGGHGTWQL